jgi:MFS family permease
MINLVVMIYMITSTIIGYVFRTFPGVPQSRIILLITIPALVALVINFVMGALTQKVSKKLLVLVALCCHFIAMMIYFFSKGQSLGALYVAAALAGVVQGSANTLCGAILADYVEPEKRGKYIATSQIFLNVGGIVWNLIAGAVAAQNGGTTWYNAYAIGFVLPVIIVAVFFLYPKKDVTVVADDAGPEAGPQMNPNVPVDGKIPGKVWSLAIMFSLFGVCMNAFNLFVSDYYINVLQLGSSAQVGVIQTAMTVAGMIVGVVYGALAKGLKNKMVSVMMVVVGLGLLAIANIHNTAGFIIGACCIGIGYLPAFSYMMAEVTNMTPMKKTGLALAIFNGISQMFAFCAQYIINFFAGLFCNEADANAMMYSRYTVTGIACFILAVIAIFMFRSSGQKKAEA